MDILPLRMNTIPQKMSTSTKKEEKSVIIESLYDFSLNSQARDKRRKLSKIDDEEIVDNSLLYKIDPSKSGAFMSQEKPQPQTPVSPGNTLDLASLMTPITSLLVDLMDEDQEESEIQEQETNVSEIDESSLEKDIINSSKEFHALSSVASAKSTIKSTPSTTVSTTTTMTTQSSSVTSVKLSKQEENEGLYEPPQSQQMDYFSMDYHDDTEKPVEEHGKEKVKKKKRKIENEDTSDDEYALIKADREKPDVRESKPSEKRRDKKHDELEPHYLRYLHKKTIFLMTDNDELKEQQLRSIQVSFDCIKNGLLYVYFLPPESYELSSKEPLEVHQGLPEHLKPTKEEISMIHARLILKRFEKLGVLDPSKVTPRNNILSWCNKAERLSYPRFLVDYFTNSLTKPLETIKFPYMRLPHNKIDVSKSNPITDGIEIPLDLLSSSDYVVVRCFIAKPLPGSFASNNIKEWIYTPHFYKKLYVMYDLKTSCCVLVGDSLLQYENRNQEDIRNNIDTYRCYDPQWNGYWRDTYSAILKAHNYTGETLGMLVVTQVLEARKLSKEDSLYMRSTVFGRRITFKSSIEFTRPRYEVERYTKTIKLLSDMCALKRIHKQIQLNAVVVREIAKHPNTVTENIRSFVMDEKMYSKREIRPTGIPLYTIIDQKKNLSKDRQAIDLDMISEEYVFFITCQVLHILKGSDGAQLMHPDGKPKWGATSTFSDVLSKEKDLLCIGDTKSQFTTSLAVITGLDKIEKVYHGLWRNPKTGRVEDVLLAIAFDYCVKRDDITLMMMNNGPFL